VLSPAGGLAQNEHEAAARTRARTHTHVCACTHAEFRRETQRGRACTGGDQSGTESPSAPALGAGAVPAPQHPWDRRKPVRRAGCCQPRSLVAHRTTPGRDTSLTTALLPESRVPYASAPPSPSWAWGPRHPRHAQTAGLELAGRRWGHPAPRRGSDRPSGPRSGDRPSRCHGSGSVPPCRRQRAGGLERGPGSAPRSWQHVRDEAGGSRRRQTGQRGRGSDAALPGCNGRRFGTALSRASGLSDGLRWSQGHLSTARKVQERCFRHLKAQKASAQDSLVHSWDRRSPHRRTFVPVTGWGQCQAPTYRLKTDMWYVQTDIYKYTPNLQCRFGTVECVSRAAPAWPRPTPAQSLPPTLGPGGEQQPAGGSSTIPSCRFRSIQVCLGDEGLSPARGTSARAERCCQPWSRPHSPQIRMSKAVNKSTLRGRCYLVLQAGRLFCWAPGEARGSPGLENKLCSTAGWALPRCRCSFHNSPEVRRARRGRREREEHSKQRVSTVTQPSLLPGKGQAPPACAQPSYMEARGWRGPPVCTVTVKLHLGVQLLADRLVSTQLTSSEAGKKTGSVDCSHAGRQLSASTDDLPRSGLSRPRKQLKPWNRREPEHRAMPNPSRFLNPSVRPGHPKRGVKGTSHSPLGAQLPAAALAQAEGKASLTKAARAGKRN